MLPFKKCPEPAGCPTRTQPPPSPPPAEQTSLATAHARPALVFLLGRTMSTIIRMFVFHQSPQESPNEVLRMQIKRMALWRPAHGGGTRLALSSRAHFPLGVAGHLGAGRLSRPTSCRNRPGEGCAKRVPARPGPELLPSRAGPKNKSASPRLISACQSFEVSI
jgi:hypothetical protein